MILFSQSVSVKENRVIYLCKKPRNRRITNLTLPTNIHWMLDRWRRHGRGKIPSE
jgi:hypothetical protein